MANLRDGEPVEIQRQKLGAWVARNVSPKDRQRVTEFIGEAVGVRFRDNPSSELAAALLDGILMGDQVRRAWVDLISAECRANPLVLVLEELQWGDAATIECIDTVMRISPDLPLFVVCVARPEIYGAFPELFAHRPMTALRLEPLDNEACCTIARSSLGDVATDVLVERITEQADGNAFFMMELVRAARDGHLSDIPLSVLAMTQRRISVLDADARRILRAASVFGHVFWQGAIRVLVNMEPSRIDQMLTKLEHDAIVTRRNTTLFHDEVEYVFHGSFVREAAYVMLTEEDQRLGHRLAGEWLFRSGETDAVVLATHYDRGGESESACRLYEMAAEQSLAVGDFTAVADLCARSIACGAVGPVLGAVRRLQAEIDVWRGDFHAGAMHGVEAMTLLPRGSPSWYVAASALAWAALAIGDHDRLLAVAGELISRIGVDSPVTSQLVVFARMAAGLYRGGYAVHAEQLIDVLMNASQAQQQIPIVAANIDEAVAWRAMYGGDRVQSYERFHASAVGFAKVGDVRNQIRVGSNAAALRMMLGEYEEAAADLRVLHRLSARLQLDNVSANIEQNLGLALTYQGAFEEARQLEERAIASFSAQGDRGLESAARIYLAMILMRLGKLDEAEHQGIEALALAENAPAFFCLALAVLADVKLAMGFVFEAREFAEHAMTLLDEVGNIEEGEAIVRLVFIECMLELGQEERARMALLYASQRLRAEALRIVDPIRRQRFLRAAPEHRRIVELVALHFGKDYSNEELFAGV
jgi:tetratricopeptide (TPR) repeat protein